MMPILGQEVAEPVELYLVAIIIFVTLLSGYVIQKWIDRQG